MPQPSLLRSKIGITASAHSHRHMWLPVVTLNPMALVDTICVLVVTKSDHLLTKYVDQVP